MISINSRLSLPWQVIAASCVSRFKIRFHVTGTLGYLLLWVLLPVFQMATAGLIYEGLRPGLVAYAVVGSAASAMIFSMLYQIGQTLDEERLRGTLVGLFLTPAPRLGWMTGFTLVGGVETSIAAAATILFGAVAFGVRFDVDWPALALTLVLFVVALWGLGFVFSAIGLWCRRSNDVSNLISPVMILLGGVFYPLSVLPLWLRIPAEGLPIPYGVQALVGASLKGQGIGQLGDQLIPLAVFALILPGLGVAAFAWVERMARRKGQLDLY